MPIVIHPFNQQLATFYFILDRTFVSRESAMLIYSFLFTRSKAFSAGAARQSKPGRKMAAIIQTTPVPKPSNMFLLRSGLLGLIGFRKKLKKLKNIPFSKDKAGSEVALPFFMIGLSPFCLLTFLPILLKSLQNLALQNKYGQCPRYPSII